MPISAVRPACPSHTLGYVRFLAALALAAALPGQDPAPPPPAPSSAVQPVVAALREASLDPDACFRVRELDLVREDVRFFFTDGYLIFAKPTLGRRVFAVFAAPEDGGDAEVLLRAPDAGERASLAAATESPNLSEHFQTAVFIFTDDTYREILSRLGEEAPRNAEMGLLLANNFNSTIRNLGASFSVRLVQDLLDQRPPSKGVFFGTVAGTRLGNFDVLVDPSLRESVVVGRMSEPDKDGPSKFNVWASFESRAARNRPALDFEEIVVPSYEIEATLQQNMNLEAVTRATISAPRPPARCLAFYIAPTVEVTSVTIDGVPMEVFRRNALRETAIRGAGSDTVLAILPWPMQPNRTYKLEFRHQGLVGRPAGNNVYFVAARTNWYPSFGLQFSRYDLTFRVPKDLEVVATGDKVEERTEGDWNITRRRTQAPVRLAGFNVGNYRKTKVQRGPYSVEVYANRLADDSLPRRTETILIPPGIRSSTGRRPLEASLPTAAIPPDPTARLTALGNEIALAFEWFSGVLGPPPLRSLSITPIPAAFGQGFPGLIYLSTLSFLREEDRPSALRTSSSALFYSEILHAHELAHQWWGNLAVPATYHDEWLSEALANYCALLVLERRKGARAVEQILDEYARNLAQPDDSGKPLDAAGPITWGVRLQSRPVAWRAITYDKGSWIFHMLRRRMGDTAFLRYLGELRRRFEKDPMTTQGVKEAAAGFLAKGDPDPKLDAFFDQWVYSTGIPTLSLTSNVQGAEPNVRLTLRLTQSGVDEEFSADVPVEIRFTAGQKPVVKWLRSSSEPVVVTVPLRRAPQKAELAPGAGILALRK